MPGRLLLKLASVLTLGAVVLVPQTPAIAQDAPRLTATGTAVQPRGPINTSLVAFACTATAPEAVAVSITSCVYTSGSGTYSAPGLSLSGPAVATAGTGFNFDDGRYQICYTARAQGADGTATFVSGCNLQTL
ncbi:MAG: hypothetical protein JWO60_3442 [Frankiales bacterium]|nr:hypothetical protein [Frankiales bacterium]